jgi:hypothetical protein
VNGLANSIFTNYAAQILPLQAAQTTFEDVVVTDLNTAGAPQGTSTIAPAVGSAGGGATNAAACKVATIHTAIRSRTGRGRIYLGGMANNDVVGPQAWTAASITAMNNDWLAFLVALAALPAPGPLFQTVVSYFSGKVPNPNPLSNRRFISQRRLIPQTNDAVQVVFHTRIASQRRRNQ